MSNIPLVTPGLVLSKAVTGEKHAHLKCLTPENGIISALQRIPGGKTRTPTPTADLFDTVNFDLRPPKTGSTGLYFVHTFELLRRRSKIGQQYSTLCLAVDYANLLIKNATHLEEHRSLFLRSGQVFDAFSSQVRPDVTFFKSLFLFAREEGFPVKEDWFASLNAEDTDAVTHTLNRPLTQTALSPDEIYRLTQNLKYWLQHHTDILLN